MSLGAGIRAARVARGWSQPDLAAKLGVARETVCRWETGVMTIPQYTRMALESVLGPLGPDKEESKPRRRRAGKS